MSASRKRQKLSHHYATRSQGIPPHVAGELKRQVKKNWLDLFLQRDIHKNRALLDCLDDKTLTEIAPLSKAFYASVKPELHFKRPLRDLNLFIKKADEKYPGASSMKQIMQRFIDEKQSDLKMLCQNLTDFLDMYLNHIMEKKVTLEEPVEYLLRSFFLMRYLVDINIHNLRQIHWDFCLRLYNVYTLRTNENATLLRAKGADVNLKRKYHLSMFEKAIYWQRPAAEIKLMITAGADVNSTNTLSWQPYNKCSATVLMVAATHGNTESAEALIDAGANVNATNEIGDTPLSHAINNGRLKTAKLLVDRGAHIHFKLEPCGSNILICAAKLDKPAILKWILQEFGNQIDINYTDNFGDTALMKAVDYRDEGTETITALLNANANVTIKNTHGETVLDKAKKRLKSIWDNKLENSYAEAEAEQVVNLLEEYFQKQSSPKRRFR